jgi:hypothetical protein
MRHSSIRTELLARVAGCILLAPCLAQAASIAVSVKDREGHPVADAVVVAVPGIRG